jgi:hypothetical protein
MKSIDGIAHREMEDSASTDSGFQRQSGFAILCYTQTVTNLVLGALKKLHSNRSIWFLTATTTADQTESECREEKEDHDRI